MKQITALVCASVVALSACTTTNDDMVVGGLLGATAGALTAKVFDADPEWIVIGALAGAAAGTLIARNESTRQCAYARGNGTYYSAPCPN